MCSSQYKYYEYRFPDPVIDTLSEWLWIKSLKVGDALDIEYGNGWFIGTITAVIPCGEKIKLLIRYHGIQYVEGIMIEYKNIKSILNKINKLHTYTLYHHPFNYDYCNLRDRISMETTRRCSICKLYLCTVCVPICPINGSFQCKFCAVKHEENIIFNAIKQSIDIDKDDIILTITRYAVGYVISCSNSSKCSNEIVIDNQFDLVHDASYYSFYQVNESLLSIDNINKMVKMYGKYYRFNCGVCALFPCSFKQCNHMDTEYNMCMDHPLCYICNKYFISINEGKCKNCERFACKECKFKGKCKSCVVSIDYFEMICAVTDAVEDNQYNCYADIIDLIIDYSMGYLINCCNFDKCKNEIAFNDRFEFNQYRLCYTYIVNNNDNIDNLVYLQGKYMKFYCNKCGSSSSNPHGVAKCFANELHQVISSWYPREAGKLTGMFLQYHDQEKVIKYLNRQDKLKKRIDCVANLLSVSGY